MPIQTNGLERPICLEHFITFEPATMAAVKPAQIGRRNLRKDSAYRLGAGFLGAHQRVEPFGPTQVHLQGVQTTQPGYLHHEAAPQNRGRRDSGRRSCIADLGERLAQAKHLVRIVQCEFALTQRFVRKCLPVKTYRHKKTPLRNG